MRRGILLMLAVVLVVCAGQTAAVPIVQVIDFEGLADYEQITNQYAGLGALFTNATALKAGGGLNPVYPPHSGVTVAYDFPGVPMRIDFTIPALDVGAYFTYGATPTMMAYDSGNVLLATAVGAYSTNYTGSGNPPNEYLSVSAGAGPPISYVTIQTASSPNSMVIDDVTITQVPEPATLSLLALGGLGLLRRRRRR